MGWKLRSEGDHSPDVIFDTLLDTWVYIKQWQAWAVNNDHPYQSSRTKLLAKMTFSEFVEAIYENQEIAEKWILSESAAWSPNPDHCHGDHPLTMAD